ncbi:MAG: ArsR/SmtB family transcription factor [Promethearchaeota archaeon]
MAEQCDAESGEDRERLSHRLVQLETRTGKQQIMDAVEIAQALAHPQRLKLLATIGDKEVCVCKLVNIVDLSQPAISHHLNILARVGLLQRRRKGRYNHYQANKKRVSQLTTTVLDLLRE